MFRFCVVRAVCVLVVSILCSTSAPAALVRLASLCSFNVTSWSICLFPRLYLVFQPRRHRHSHLQHSSTCPPSWATRPVCCWHMLMWLWAESWGEPDLLGGAGRSTAEVLSAGPSVFKSSTLLSAVAIGTLMDNPQTQLLRVRWGNRAW